MFFFIIHICIFFYTLYMIYALFFLYFPQHNCEHYAPFHNNLLYSFHYFLCIVSINNIVSKILTFLNLSNTIYMLFSLFYCTKIGISNLIANPFSYLILKNFFAFCVVSKATSSNETPLISAIFSATCFTWAISFLFPL